VVYVYNNEVGFVGVAGFDPNMAPQLESLQVPPEQQYLQLTAVNRCNSRLSAVYADGST
jgi:hypothetical protein